MKGARVQADKLRESEQTVTVPEDHNSLVVRLHGHTWAAVSAGANERVRIQSPDPAIAFTLAPGTYVVRTDGKIKEVTTESFRQEPSLLEQLRQEPPAFLTVTADAPDRHVVDGIGEIAADGTSYCTITIQKMALNGVELKGNKDHQDELFLRTTGGVIMDDKGGERIRSLKLRSGRAAFRLVSEPSPKIVSVSVFSRDPLLAKAEIQIEFV